MVALYIFSAIAALICAIIFSKARIRIEYSTNLKITLYFWFFKYTLFPQKKVKKQSKKDKTKPKTTDKKPNDKIDESIKKKGFTDTFLELKGAIMPIIKALGTLVSYIHVSPFNFELIMAGKDAADLAIDYGKLCSVFYPFLAFLCELMKFGKKHVYIGVDYVLPKHEIKLDLTLKLRLNHALSFGIKSVFHLVKQKIKAINSKSAVKNKTNSERISAK